MSLYSFDKSMEAYRRAMAVMPAGISGNKNPAFAVPGSFPYFAEKGEGCYYWDVDGNKFIDYLCGYGPIVLGHHHPKIDEAARRQAELGSSFNHPTLRTVELAEKMVDLIDIADWACFGRNGSDVTTFLIQVARQHTKRSKILFARGAYHGSHPWCTPGHGGVIDEDKQHVRTFTWNDATELEDKVKACDGDVAGIMLTPYHHPAFNDSVMPAEGFMDDVRRICDENGIVFILDDVRAGFRLHMGGSHCYFGYTPDLSCFCKAIANGYSISAAVGKEEFKTAASKVFFTGTFYTSAVEIAAALACLKTLEEEKAIEKMMRLGRMLQDGLQERAEAHGLQITLSGPPTIPYMSFANETHFKRSQVFSGNAARRGIILHPHHNWFLSAAHEEEDIQQTLIVADECFAVVKEQFGG